MTERWYFVYILASKPYGTIYIGVTRHLVGRVIQHRDELIEGFTKRYGVKRLTLRHFKISALPFSEKNL
jgi:putative endonuclease